jgi:hypothetical protein
MVSSLTDGLRLTVVHLPAIIENPLGEVAKAAVAFEPLCLHAATHSKPKWPVVAISHRLPSVPSKFDFDGHDTWQECG